MNDRCSDLNGTQQRMKEGAEALGWSFRTILRNIDESLYDPATAGYIGFGDRSGAKQTTTKTYLADAAARGTEFVVHCFADRIITERGRATGVEATYVDPATGRRSRVTVRAPRVVVAAGSLESPGAAAALRPRRPGGRARTSTSIPAPRCSGATARISAPGGGRHRPASWTSSPRWRTATASCSRPPSTRSGIGASAVPFMNGEEHKELMHRFRHGATFIGLVRDRGAGRVTVDADGQAVPWYSLTDELDVRNSRRAIEAQIRLHHAADAREIMPLAVGMPRWRPGDDLERFIERCQRIPLRAGGYRLFSAHQMGTCRMGTDPATSVAGPEGELHDTPGVWVGDASAFPTSSGTNPMITIMALARRTGEAILASSPATAATAPS